MGCSELAEGQSEPHTYEPVGRSFVVLFSFVVTNRTLEGIILVTAIAVSKLSARVREES